VQKINIGGIQMSDKVKLYVSKVPQVTIFFWIIKVLCTTVGETASDYFNETLGMGLLATTIGSGIILAIIMYLQFKSKKYIPVLYWLTVAMVSVFGTLVTDNLTDGLGVPLEFSTIFFSVLLLITFGGWYRSEKSLSIHSITTPKREMFYWLTILVTFALGTAAGDLISEGLGFGYLPTAGIVGGVILFAFTAGKLGLNSILTFWITYIMTRPLGASIGDYLSQDQSNGGLGLGTTWTSLIFIALILIIVAVLAVTKLDTIEKIETEERHGFVKQQVFATIAAFTIFFTGGYFWRTHQLIANGPHEITQADLADFVTIEKDVEQLAQKNDFAQAKTRVKDLETAWDAEAGRLKHADKAHWTELDGGIDDVLSAVRSKTPNTEAITTSIEQSLSSLQS
jgi:uncharacterized membrane-anchored protein